ncbi:MAG TPA: hypothetical protein VG265_12995 [Gaiellaceae bacterium]|jgi:hypothetical protein|nr:hypothetical protein [Gaiellaceae bacterium]
MQGNRSAGGSAVRSGFLTGVATAAVSGAAGVAGAILSRKFGHGATTDGFFAAYAVYLALLLVASSLRVVVLPDLARAQQVGGLPRELGSWAAALAVPLGPALAVGILAPHAVAGLLTDSPEARRSATELLPWLALAAAAQVYAGVAASALAARDDYTTAAAGYVAGAVAGVAAIGALVGHGVAAFGWGLALNGIVSLAIPLVALIRLRAVGRPLAGGARRLRSLGAGVAVPFALQGLYIVGYRFASGLGTGKPTTFSYAYLISSLLVAVTATSIALISSVPLARVELSPERSARHIVSATWVSLALVAGAAGVFALAGRRVARIGLGSSYGGETGAELGRLVAYFAPWMIASIALSVAFPLLFVRGRAGWLPLLAAGGLGVHVLAEWIGRSAFGLAGVVAAMAVSTFAILAVLLWALGSLAATSRGILLAAATCGGLAVLLYGAPALVLGALPAAGVGLVLYAGAIALWRPRGLVEAWSYLRRLHDG